MTAIDTASVRRYIEELELPEPDIELQALGPFVQRTTGEKEAAYVDKGSLVSFVSGLNQQHKDDVLNSTLLASLAANKKHDPENAPEEWYSEYRTVLGKCYWNIQAVNWDKVKSTSVSFDVSTVIFDLIEAMLGPGPVLTLLKATIDKAKQLGKNDNRLKLFDKNAHEASKGNFQIACAQEDNNDVLLNFGAFYFTTKSQVTELLWAKFSSSETEFFNGAQTMVLNETGYNGIRQVVIDKLGKNAKDFIADLDI